MAGPSDFSLERPERSATREGLRPRVVAIFGPTGVGKTDVAIALADLLRGRGEDPLAVSADALQLYEGMERLTGAPTAAQRARLEHRLVGIVPVSRLYSVGEFMPRAHAEIDAALAAGRRPIVVGGTGLYLRAALADLDLRPPPAPELRARLERELAASGPRALHERLGERAPQAAERIAPTDRNRLVRALELAEMDALGDDGSEVSQLWSGETRHPTLLMGLVMGRSRLDARIDARVDAIVATGAAQEVRRAAAAGASRTARGAVGFRELLEGDVEGMKRRTRSYARRQLTWMRKLRDVHAVDVTDRSPRDVAAEAAALL